MNVLTVASATAALIGTIAGGVWALEARMDSKYVPAAKFDRFYINSLQEQIRNIERDLREEKDPRIRGILLADLARLLDEYCLEADDKRRCESRQ